MQQSIVPQTSYPSYPSYPPYPSYPSSQRKPSESVRSTCSSGRGNPVDRWPGEPHGGPAGPAEWESVEGPLAVWRSSRWLYWRETVCISSITLCPSPPLFPVLLISPRRGAWPVPSGIGRNVTRTWRRAGVIGSSVPSGIGRNLTWISRRVGVIGGVQGVCGGGFRIS